MGGVLEVWTLIAGVLLIWLIVSFYWLRVVAVLAILLAWGGVAIALPLWLVFTSVAGGAPFAAIVQLGAAGLLGFLWSIAAKAALDWYRRQERFDTFWKPWTER